VVADALVNRARSFIYTTGLPPVCLSWLLLVWTGSGHEQGAARLQELAAGLRGDLTRLGLTTGGTSQIVPLIIGESSDALRVARRAPGSGMTGSPRLAAHGAGRHRPPAPVADRGHGPGGTAPLPA